MSPTDRPYSPVPFNWMRAIDSAIKDKIEHGSPTHADLVNKAKTWVTCACGNLCESIPRLTSGEPVDVELTSLGLGFHSFIEKGDYLKAKACLLEIEERSSELLKEMAATTSPAAPSDV